jgi:hypothetical protein
MAATPGSQRGAFTASALVGGQQSAPQVAAAAGGSGGHLDTSKTLSVQFVDSGGAPAKGQGAGEAR